MPSPIPPESAATGSSGDEPSGEDRSTDEALRWAQSLREARAEVCSSISDGRVSLDRVLQRRSDPLLGPVHLLCVLEAVPGARKVDTRRALASLGLPERVPISSLSDDQVALISSEFTGVTDRG